VAIRVIAAGLSDVGLHREHNEDSFALIDQHGLYLVADGMGGHKAGDVASKMATETLRAFFDSTAREDATWPFHYDPALSAEENRLMAGIKVANKSIYERSATSDEHRGMGTTLVGVLIAATTGKAYIGHVGDSRCYRVRGRSIAQLTQDHSLINEYLRAMPHLSAAQRDELPRNVITRALGMNDRVVVDVASEEAVAGDRYILCSDGLSGMISDDEILRTLLAHADDQAACEALIALANAHGGEDNITAVIVRIVDPDGAAERKAEIESTRETVPPGAPDA
jgi:PPM family protein phosphatase